MSGGGSAGALSCARWGDSVCRKVIIGPTGGGRRKVIVVCSGP